MRILIKNGKVFDGEKFFLADVLTNNAIVEKIAPQITDCADYTFDATNCIVAAGLVDIHTHMKHLSSDSYGTPIDMACLPFGVTSAVDGGILKGNREILSSFAVGVSGFVAVDVKNDTADFTRAEKLLELFGDKCLGFKLFFDTANAELKTLKPLTEICAVARQKCLKVMVHCNNSPTSMEEIVDALSGGDILTHVYHGGKNTIAENGYIAYRKAKEKGVVLDVGMAGHVHTDFGVLRSALSGGFYPDTISTDVTCASTFSRGGRYGMTMAMSVMKDCGLPEQEIFKAVTVNAAKAVGFSGSVGNLAVGKPADVAVFDYTKEPYSLTDKAGNTISNSLGYKCRLTVKNGKILYR